jgi:hypothetical protein
MLEKRSSLLSLRASVSSAAARSIAFEGIGGGEPGVRVSRCRIGTACLFEPPKLTNAASPSRRGHYPASLRNARWLNPEMTTFVPDRTKPQYLCRPTQLTTYRREARDGAIQSPAPAGADASPSVWPCVCSPGSFRSIWRSLSPEAPIWNGSARVLADIRHRGHCLSASSGSSI